MTLIEQLKSKKEWLKTTAENLSAFQSGSALAFLSAYLPKMIINCYADNNLDRSLTAWESYTIIILLPLGAIVGTVISALLLYIIGRLKSILLMAVLPFLVVYVLMIFKSDLTTIYNGRFFIGLAVGSTYLLLPIYNVETCTGYSSNEVYIVFFAFHAGGVWFSFIVNGFGRTIIFYILSAVISLISFLLTLFYLRESPYDLVKKGKFTEAESVLMRMQSRPRSDIDKELRAMEALANQREATTYNDLRKQKCDINALTISAILLALPHISSVMAFITFGQLFYDELNINPFSQKPPAVWVAENGFVHLGVSLIIFRLLTKYKERDLLLASLILITVSLSICCVFYVDGLLGLEIPMKIGWLPILTFSLLLGGFSLGCAFFPWMIMMQLFAPLLVHNALVVMCIYFWSLYFVICTLIFMLIEYHFILGLLFLIFAVGCGYAAYLVHTRLIDTKGKTYAEIKVLLNKY